MSGFWRTMPPFVAARKLPGVTALPSMLKNERRGPSELNHSIWFVLLNAFGYGPLGVGRPKAAAAGVAATPIPKAVAECPRVCPGVLNASRPRLVVTLMKR